MAMRRSFPTVLSDRLPETRDFYVALLGFEVAFDSDWYVALTLLDGDEAHELAIWAVGHELVPPPYRADPAGVDPHVPRRRRGRGARRGAPGADPRGRPAA